MRIITAENQFDQYLNSGYSVRSVNPRFKTKDSTGFNCEYQMVAEKKTNRFLAFFNFPLLIGNFSTWSESVLQGKRLITYIATPQVYAKTIEKYAIDKQEEIAISVLRATATFFNQDEIADQKKSLKKKLSGNEEIFENNKLIEKILNLNEEEHCLLAILVKALKDAEGEEEYNHQYFSSVIEKNKIGAFLKVNSPYAVKG